MLSAPYNTLRLACLWTLAVNDASFVKQLNDAMEGNSELELEGSSQSLRRLRDDPCLPRRRKEIHDLTESEFKLYVKAIQKVKNGGKWKKFADIHRKMYDKIHKTDGSLRDNGFLRWHRQFIFDMETELIKAMGNNCDITIPYWEWNNDTTYELGKSYIWESKRFGSNNGACISSDHFEEWTPCIKRSWNPKNKKPGHINKMLNIRHDELLGREYNSEWRRDLQSLHNSIHRFTGGMMNSFGSPYDPLFYSHHAKVDYIWTQKKPSAQTLRVEYVKAVKLSGEVLSFYNGVEISEKELVQFDTLNRAWKAEEVPQTETPQPEGPQQPTTTNNKQQQQ